MAEEIPNRESVSTLESPIDPKFEWLAEFRPTEDRVADVLAFAEKTNRQWLLDRVPVDKESPAWLPLIRKELQLLLDARLEWTNPNGKVHQMLGLEDLEDREPDLQPNSRYVRLIAIPKEEVRILSESLANWDEQVNFDQLADSVKQELNGVITDHGDWLEQTEERVLGDFASYKDSLAVLVPNDQQREELLSEYATTIEAILDIIAQDRGTLQSLTEQLSSSEQRPEPLVAVLRGFKTTLADSRDRVDELLEDMPEHI